MRKNIYIGLGSNLGNREENINRAIHLLREKCKILKVSSIYETEPVGYKNQGLFLNCAVEAETGLKPQELQKFFHSIEKILGRVKTIKNGPRTMDLDILFYDGHIIKSKNLAIPHPRLHERLFVLEPLKELCPNFIHPVLRKTINELKTKIFNRRDVKNF